MACCMSMPKSSKLISIWGVVWSMPNPPVVPEAEVEFAVPKSCGWAQDETHPPARPHKTWLPSSVSNRCTRY